MAIDPEMSEGTVNFSRRRSRRLSLLLFAAYASLVAVFQGVQNILIPTAVQRLSPDTKVSTLALLTTLSAVTTIIAFLTGGLLSDRTRSRFGRRTPWLVGMAVAVVVLMLAVGSATSVTALVILMPILWFAANFYQTVVTTILPDRVPVQDRGFASAAIALGVPVGIFVGVNVAAAAPTPFTGYVLLTVPIVVFTVALVLLDREPSSLPMVRSVAGNDAQTTPAGGYLSAFASRDFTLTFVSRFLLFLSFFTANGYLFYVLQDYVGLTSLPGQSAAQAISTVLSITTIAWLTVTPLTGLLADRVGHTAGVVGWTSIAIGAVLIVPAFTNAWSGMLVLGVGLGLTFGVYFAIDLKLASLVLPSSETAGRDIGLMGIAGSGPTVMAPALAAAIIEWAGFPALFIVSAVLAIAGGLAAFPIRVRSPARKARP